MRRQPHRRTAWLLVAQYALLAAAGHGLHTCGGVGEDRCVSDSGVKPPAETACPDAGCFWHARAAARSTADDGRSLRGWSVGAGAACGGECDGCRVATLLKLAAPNDAPSPVESSPVGDKTPPLYAAPLSATAVRVLARGPPAPRA